MKKALAVIISSVFIFNVSSQSVSAAAFENVLPKSAYNINKDFAVNEYNTSAQNSVFLIQDLHCHYGVQNKMASFLENLSAQPNFNKIYIEGASKNIETSFIKNLSDGIKTVLAKDLLSQGKISGAEYFFLMSKEKIPLYGLENKELYEGNALRLEYILATQEKVQPIISEMDKALNALQRKTLDNSGKKMLVMLRKYESGQISQQKFYSYIIKQAEKSGINAENYSLIKSIINLPQKINYGKVQKELRAYMEEAKAILPYSVYKDLNEENIFEKITEISASYGIDLTKYADLRDYLKIYTNHLHMSSTAIQDKKLVSAPDILIVLFL